MMTEKDHQEAAIRRAAREITKPLRLRLGYCERTINALRQKLEAAERDILEKEREILRLKRNL